MQEHRTGEHPGTEELERLLLRGAVRAPAEETRRHVRACDACRRELDELRILQRALEALPRPAPSPGFTRRVMARVRLPVPLHVRAWNGLREHGAAAALVAIVASTIVGAIAIWGALQAGLLPEAATSLTADTLTGLLWSGILQLARMVWATGIPGAATELLGNIGLTEALGVMGILGVSGLAAAAALFRLLASGDLRAARMRS